MNACGSARLLILSSILAVAFGLRSDAQSHNEATWISPTQQAALWGTARSDFHDELQPDDPAKTAPVLAYKYKYIYRIAMYSDSALVLLGYRETQDSKYPGYYGAFNYDLHSRAITPIKGAEVLSEFKFIKFASLDSELPQDITFSWMTCTECEASQILSTFHYDAGKSQWVLRAWQVDKSVWWTGGSGPVIWTDTFASDVISFSCLHGLLKAGDSNVFAMRCREIDQGDDGKREITDVTVRYTFDRANSNLEILRAGTERTKLLAELCERSPNNRLCRNAAIGAYQKK